MKKIVNLVSIVTLLLSPFIVPNTSSAQSNQDPWKAFVASPNDTNFQKCEQQIKLSHGKDSKKHSMMILNHASAIQANLLELVKEGNKYAMELCIQLYKIFAGYPSDLENFDEALGKSVRKNPKTFVYLVCRYHNLFDEKDSPLDLGHILGHTPEELIDNFDGMKKEEMERIKAIESVQVRDSSCAAVKKSCIDALNRVIDDLSQ